MQARENTIVVIEEMPSYGHEHHNSVAGNDGYVIKPIVHHQSDTGRYNERPVSRVLSMIEKLIGREG